MGIGGDGPRTSVRTHVRRVTRWCASPFTGEADEEHPASGERGDAAAPRSDSAPAAWLDDLDPDDLNTLGDAVEAVGLTPEAFVLRLVEEEDPLRQQAVSEYTNWSESTITRLLQKMERNGLIGRVQIGREKLVYLPEGSPLDDLSATRESEDPRTV